ncbi:MAG: hypothetical protein NUV82_02895 [Candidatus Komeilibacteria bacterium]|nr:hypothetical protein [Candidatus Komeilibacteria bacterium]
MKRKIKGLDIFWIIVFLAGIFPVEIVAGVSYLTNDFISITTGLIWIWLLFSIEAEIYIFSVLYEYEIPRRVILIIKRKLSLHRYGFSNYPVYSKPVDITTHISHPAVWYLAFFAFSAIINLGKLGTYAFATHKVKGGRLFLYAGALARLGIAYGVIDIFK